MRTSFILTLFIGLTVLSVSACSGKKAEEPAAPTLPPPVAPQATAEILNCGEIQAHAPIDTTAAPNTGLGTVNVMHEHDIPKFKPGCPKINAKVGTRFGIHVLVSGHSGQSIIILKTRVTHPAITNPATGVATMVDEWQSPMNSGIARYAGWSFDKPWELVPGEWKMEILEGERVIAAQNFTVSIKK